MLTSLALTNFRGFDQLEIPRLARVNLIGGVNNAGKTAILEAVFLLLERHEARLATLPSLFRAVSGIDDVRYFWRWLARGGHTQNVFTISAGVPGFGLVRHTCPWKEDDPNLAKNEALKMALARLPVGRNGRTLIVEEESWDQSKPPPKWPHVETLPLRPTPPVEDAQIYIRAAKRSGNEERIEALLREIEPRLKRVRNYPDEETNQPLLYADLGTDEALPTTQLGQGFNRLLRIYSALLGAEANVFLIDEVESGLHYSILPTIWEGLAAIARQENVQIFATTHSREAILAAHQVFSAEAEYDFAYHRLERDAKGEIQVVTYDQEALAGADEANFELR